MKPNLLSGIQPTGRLHLGNYLGALDNFVKLQNSGRYNCLFFIADLHSLTEDFKPKDKTKQIINLMADYLAAGLNPKKSTIFIQSQIPANSELAWILNTITPFGELSRMTQFKDKSKDQSSNINVGLFSYPILMTADVILYDAHFVPVGEDQIQHLELSRILTRKFNKKFGKTFIEPQPLLTEVPRLMSLNNPHNKMSKSRPQECIFVDDSPAIIKKKVMTATTDSGKEIKYDLKKKAGVSNLITIYASLSGKSIKGVEKEFKEENYASFKKSLADLINQHFSDYRKKKKQLLANPEKLKKIAAQGAKKVNKIANSKITKVRNRLGLL
jgi:tryptophanyl-tRNA synthetase